MSEKLKHKKPFWKRFLKTIVIIAASLIAIYTGLNLWLRIPDPKIADMSLTKKEVIQNNGFSSFGNNRLRHSESGLWEMYVEGDEFERGVAIGKLEKNLLNYQETVFVEQIKQIIPSNVYLSALRIFIGFFNRNLPKNIPDEYKKEIYGISLSCTHAYDNIGTPYERQLNYHAAHDVGHAMQDYMLVGCTSFAVWNRNSADSTLLIGRNFDFYVGDDFARNKIVAFYKPAHGHKFAMVTWAGMIGVLSGMNDAGLTVTINAAKSSIPTSSATPISILCREILQYASTVDEAYAIAKKRKTFVSESILVGSAKDNCAVIIEKSPDNMGIYRSNKEWLVCANHYQSDTFENDAKNIENINTSDSPYRQKRMEELIERDLPVNPQKAASILRNKEGVGDKHIGLGNEKSINQLICHHSVIFEPEKQLMWVSTAPWQIGKYEAYDLNKIFKHPDFSQEIHTDSLTIKEDDFLHSIDYQKFLQYRSLTKIIKRALKEKTPLPANTVTNYISANPEFFYVYDLAGDYFRMMKNNPEALKLWNSALTKEIPEASEKQNIQKKIDKNK